MGFWWWWLWPATHSTVRRRSGARDDLECLYDKIDLRGRVTLRRNFRKILSESLAKADRTRIESMLLGQIQACFYRTYSKLARAAFKKFVLFPADCETNIEEITDIFRLPIFSCEEWCKVPKVYRARFYFAALV